MTTTRQRHPLSARAARLRTSRHDASPPRRRSQVAPDEPRLIAAMGPANHPPGAPTMGAPGLSPHPVMGAPDAAPRVSVMGEGDHGPWAGLFGASDSAFVDWLFTGG